MGTRARSCILAVDWRITRFSTMFNDSSLNWTFHYLNVTVYNLLGFKKTVHSLQKEFINPLRNKQPHEHGEANK